MRIDEAVYGPEHPQVAIDANNLGTILQDQGDLTEARRWTERVLRILEKTYGPDNPSRKVVAGNLAVIVALGGGPSGD